MSSVSIVWLQQILECNIFFKTQKSLSQIKPLERCYISVNEKEYYKNIRLEESRLGDNKVKLARKQYRGKGKYIDEILV